MTYTAFQLSQLNALRKIPGTPYSVTGVRKHTRRRIKEDIGSRSLSALYERRRLRLRFGNAVKAAVVGKDGGTVAKVAKPKAPKIIRKIVTAAQGFGRMFTKQKAV